MSATGTLNKRVGITVLTVLALLCAFLAIRADAYTRALDADGVTVEGAVTGQTLRPCMIGDFCLRDKRPDLTHVGYATIGYRDTFGIAHLTRKAINNETAARYPQGRKVPVTFPRHDAANASTGDPAANRAWRGVMKIAYVFAALVLIAAAFWVSTLNGYELCDFTEPRRSAWGDGGGDGGIGFDCGGD